MDRFRIALLSLEPENSEPFRERVLAPAAALSERVELLLGGRPEEARVRMDFEAIERADVILVQRLFPTRSTWSDLERLLRSPTPVVYDLDDLPLRPQRDEPDSLRIQMCVPYIQRVLDNAQTVMVSTTGNSHELSSENIVRVSNPSAGGSADDFYRAWTVCRPADTKQDTREWLGL